MLPQAHEVPDRAWRHLKSTSRDSSQVDHHIEIEGSVQVLTASEGFHNSAEVEHRPYGVSGSAKVDDQKGFLDAVNFLGSGWRTDGQGLK